jgi:glycosyltransferase involved in cell wall biosynthesis
MLDRLLALQRLFESEPFDLVHAQFGYVGHLCVPVLSWFKSLPLIVSFRGQDASALPLKLPGLYAPLFRRGNLFLARSEAMRRDLLAIGCPPEKVRVHHSGIDLAQFPYRERHVPDESEPLRILFVGRLIAKKGVLDAVAAFAEARRHHPNIQLRIIGEGPLREQIAREAAERNSAAAILLLGPKFHAEVASEMAAAHIFLLPSRTAPDGDKEGIPNALMEAMASGLPVLSTRHAGIPECVADGVSGLLVPEGDVQALAERLQWLIQNPQRWADMGRAARAKIAAEFNRDIQAQRLISIYKEVLTPS